MTDAAGAVQRQEPRRPGAPHLWYRWAAALTRALRHRPVGATEEEFREFCATWCSLRERGFALPSLRQIGEETGHDHSVWARRLRRWRLPRPPIGRGPRPPRNQETEC